MQGLRSSCRCCYAKGCQEGQTCRLDWASSSSSSAVVHVSGHDPAGITCHQVVMYINTDTMTDTVIYIVTYTVTMLLTQSVSQLVTRSLTLLLTQSITQSLTSYLQRPHCASCTGKGRDSGQEGYAEEEDRKRKKISRIRKKRQKKQ